MELNIENKEIQKEVYKNLCFYILHSMPYSYKRDGLISIAREYDNVNQIPTYEENNELIEKERLLREKIDTFISDDSYLRCKYYTYYHNEIDKMPEINIDEISSKIKEYEILRNRLNKEVGYMEMALDVYIKIESLTESLMKLQPDNPICIAYIDKKIKEKKYERKMMILHRIFIAVIGLGLAYVLYLIMTGGEIVTIIALIIICFLGAKGLL
jgi:hypothetical protein